MNWRDFPIELAEELAYIEDGYRRYLEYRMEEIEREKFNENERIKKNWAEEETEAIQDFNDRLIQAEKDRLYREWHNA